MSSVDAFTKQINDSLKGPGVIGEFPNDLSKSMAEKIQIDSWVSEQPSTLAIKNFKLSFSTLINENIPQSDLQAREYKTLDEHSFEVPLNVRSFANRQGIIQRLGELKKAVQSIEAFLKEKNTNGTVTLDLSSDPEYPEWKHIEVKIRINKDLDSIYKNLKPAIFTLIEESISEELLSKILITFDTLK